MTEVSAAEKERRRKISESARDSAAREAYYARIRGVKKGPDSLETRAAKSASHKAPRNTPEWTIYYEHALRRFQQAEELRQKLAAK